MKLSHYQLGIDHWYIMMICMVPLLQSESGTVLKDPCDLKYLIKLCLCFNELHKRCFGAFFDGQKRFKEFVSVLITNFIIKMITSAFAWWPICCWWAGLKNQFSIRTLIKLSTVIFVWKVCFTLWIIRAIRYAIYKTEHVSDSLSLSMSHTCILLRRK